MKRRRLVARSTIGVMTVSPPRLFCRISYRAGAAMETGAIAMLAPKLPSFARDKGTITMPNGKPTIAFIGFGEAGQAIAAGLREAGVETMAAWDILFPQAAGEKLKRAAEAAGV